MPNSIRGNYAAVCQWSLCPNEESSKAKQWQQISVFLLGEFPQEAIRVDLGMQILPRELRSS
jgi:hypothetical protein